MLSERDKSISQWWRHVLILVVMEYALGGEAARLVPRVHASLNPCCNGICSRRNSTTRMRKTSWRLNPCCNGICSRRMDEREEDGLQRRLNPCCNGICSRRNALFPQRCRHRTVLILVVMEYALGVAVSMVVSPL